MNGLSDMMYFIEVYFENGKVLRKETDSLNESFKTYMRYSNNANKRISVVKIITGRIH